MCFQKKFFFFLIAGRIIRDDYIGCYINEGLEDQFLREKDIHLNETNSPESCTLFCLLAGYAIAGTQNG